MYHFFINKYLVRVLPFFVVFLGTVLASQAQITVQSNRTALQLAQAITGNGVTVINATLNCAPTGNATFSSPNNTVGLDAGIVLSTGNTNQIGLPEPGTTSTNLNRNGDPDLTAISGTTLTRDACVLEFDVIPSGDELKFDYVFASEEYINAVCGPFNDVFAFFISGPGVTGTKNIALVPNTAIPVAVNSVNNGIVGSYSGSTWSNCTGMGAGSPFTQYYVDNTGNQFFAYKGYTSVFAARQSVVPCQTYHLKLAIADAGNALFDSGVLIKGGSLSSTSISGNVTAPLTINSEPTAIKGCTNAQVHIQRSQVKTTAQPVQLVVAGNAQVGVDYAAFPATVTIPANAASTNFTINSIATSSRGDRSVVIYVVDPFNCTNTIQYSDTIVVQLMEMPTAQLLTEDDTICAGVSLNTRLQASSSLFQYQWTPNYNISSTTIAEPQLFPAVGTTYFVSAQIPNSGCAATRDSVTVSVIAGPEGIQFSEEDISICKGENVTVSATVAPLIDGLVYSWSGPNGFSSSGTSISLNNAEAEATGWYYLNVSATGCNTITDSVRITIINNVRVPNIAPKDVCQYEAALINDAPNYHWYENATGGFAMNGMPEWNTNELGKVTYYLSQTISGCESSRVPVTINVMKCCDKDLFIPNAFSPNNDGMNDTYEIKLDPGSKLNAFQVYNRWGQRVYISTSANVNWDGKFNQQDVADGVYFYYFQMQCLDGSLVEKKGEIHVVR